MYWDINKFDGDWLAKLSTPFNIVEAVLTAVWSTKRINEYLRILRKFKMAPCHITPAAAGAL